MECLPTPHDWSALTLVPEKSALFERDLYFRESWSLVVDVFGVAASATPQQLAMVSIKPDAVVSRRAANVLAFLRGHGFLPVAVARMRHTRRSIREMWRYNWNVLTIDRIALNTLMYGATDTLVVALLDTRYDGMLPGTVRLSELKGTVGPDGVSKETLRGELGCRGQMFSFVHVADEPADLVRELGIMFDRDRLLEILLEVRASIYVNRYDKVLAQLVGYEASQPVHDLAFEHSITSVVAHREDPRESLSRLRRAASSTSKLSWSELLSIVDPHHPDVDLWDFLTVASEVISSFREGFPDLLPGSRASDWTGGPPRRA